MFLPGFAVSIYDELWWNIMITIGYDDVRIEDCSSAVIVPEIAITEPGYIKAFTSSGTSGAKHEFQALAQMAYFQYQDDELELTEMSTVCRIDRNGGYEDLISGLIIYRDGNGTLHAAVHAGLNRKKLLEAANRYCTRWVRLDI